MGTTEQADYQRMSPRDKLAAARLKARQDSPYFASALLNLIPREAIGLGTLGVTEGMILMWDSEAIQSWPLEELSATLEHEVMHVLRGHAARARRLGIIGADGRAVDPQLAKLWNLAGDCEINDDFEQTRPHLFTGPRGSILPKHFKLDNGLLAESYYDGIRQQAAKQPKPKQGQGQGQQGQGQGQGDGEGEGQNQAQGQSGGSGDPTQGPGRPRAGRCGGCSGNPNDNEPGQGGRSNQPDKAQGATQPGDADGDGGRTEAEVDRIRKQVAHAIRDHVQRGRGNVPGGWLRWAEESLAPPKVRWQDKLARLARAAVAWKAGMVDLRHDRTSRRQWGIGVGVGRPMLPALRAPVPRIAVGVDTSGSMGTTELTAALRESRGIFTAVGAQVTFGACDAEVHALKPVKSWQEIPAMLKGGGGTDFRPMFTSMEKAKGGKPDVLIMITDGDGPAPTEAPTGMKIIWLLVGQHRRRPYTGSGGPVTYGEFIEVDE